MPSRRGRAAAPSHLHAAADDIGRIGSGRDVEQQAGNDEEPELVNAEHAQPPMRRQPAGWQPQWRRSAPDGVRFGTVQSAAVNSTFAYRGFLSRQRNSHSANKAQHDRMVPPHRRVEGAAKIATPPSSDPHIAVVFLPRPDRQRSKSSLRKCRAPARCAGPNRYPGANPNARSKRLA